MTHRTSQSYRSEVEAEDDISPQVVSPRPALCHSLKGWAEQLTKDNYSKRSRIQIDSNGASENQLDQEVVDEWGTALQQLIKGKMSFDQKVHCLPFRK